MDILKEQVHVVANTIQHFNNTVDGIEKTNQIFLNNFRALQSMTTTIGKSLSKTEVMERVTSHMLLLTSVITQLDEDTNTLINAILFAKINAVHPSIITPLTYLNELRATLPYLTPTTDYALTLSIQNAKSLLSLVSINTIYNEKTGNIIFIINTPIVTRTSYNLFEVIPLPASFNLDHHVLILPDIKYLAVTSTISHYIVLRNLQSCQILPNSERICIVENPIIATHSHRNCEIDLLINQNQLPNTCEKRIIKMPSETWHKLNQPNTWIFVIANEIYTTLKCSDNAPEDIKLTGTGILSLNPTCSLITTSSTIKASSRSSNNTTIISKFILPNFNISNLEIHPNLNKNTNFTPLQLKAASGFSLDREDLDISSHKLIKISNEINKLEIDSQNVAVKHHQSFLIYFVSFLIIIFTFIKIFIRCRRRILTRFHANSRNQIEPTIELQQMASTSHNVIPEPTEEFVPRRSGRLARLKTSY